MRRASGTPGARTWRTRWSWRAGADRQDWIDSAAAEANTFLLRQLAFERFRQMGVMPDRLGQIAYGTNMLVQTYAALYRATGDENICALRRA